MNEEKQALSKFLHNQQARYCNPAGIVFYMIADGLFFVSAKYPDVKQSAEISLELYQQFDYVNELTALLHISDVARLVDLEPKDLLGLYERELLNVVCTLEGVIDHEISFRKYRGAIWARNTNEEIHQVKIHIDKPEDFITYTLPFYNMDGN